MGKSTNADVDCLPTSLYPTALGPPDQSEDVNTQAHRARCYPRGSESSDMNDVDTRPITVAANLELVRCLPDTTGPTDCCAA